MREGTGPRRPPPTAAGEPDGGPQDQDSQEHVRARQPPRDRTSTARPRSWLRTRVSNPPPGARAGHGMCCCRPVSLEEAKLRFPRSGGARPLARGGPAGRDAGGRPEETGRGGEDGPGAAAFDAADRLPTRPACRRPCAAYRTARAWASMAGGRGSRAPGASPARCEDEPGADRGDGRPRGHRCVRSSSRSGSRASSRCE